MFVRVDPVVSLVVDTMMSESPSLSGNYQIVVVIQTSVTHVACVTFFTHVASVTFFTHVASSVMNEVVCCFLKNEHLTMQAFPP